MTDPQQMVAEFHRHVGAAIRTRPTVDVPAAEMRVRFVEEEARELREAVVAGDVVAVADALADLAYVVYGGALHFGIPLADVLAEVHRSNMTKTPAGDGKAIKGAGYRPPRIAYLLTMDTGDEMTPEEAAEEDPDCAAKGCDIREGYSECRRCGAEVVLDDDEDGN